MKTKFENITTVKELRHLLRDRNQSCLTEKNIKKICNRKTFSEYSGYGNRAHISVNIRPEELLHINI